MAASATTIEEILGMDDDVDDDDVYIRVSLYVCGKNNLTVWIREVKNKNKKIFKNQKKD